MPISLLDLPIEVQCQVAGELPLSSYIILASQVCRQLRIGLAQCGPRKDLCTRFSLAAWRAAAEEVRSSFSSESLPNCSDVQHSKLGNQEFNHATRKSSIWDTDAKKTPRPAAALPMTPALRRTLKTCTGRGTGRIGQHEQQLLDSAVLTKEGKPDVVFLNQCLQLLFGDMQSSRAAIRLTPLAGKSHSAALRSISMLSQTSIDVSCFQSLIKSSLACLAGLKTVLVTSAEISMWHEFEFAASYSNEKFEFDCDEEAKCTETQAIAIPSCRAQRGRGVRIGFKCFCYGKRKRSSTDSGQGRFIHVILHDWYDKEEALATEDMLSNSAISCNWCGQAIEF